MKILSFSDALIALGQSILSPILIPLDGSPIKVTASKMVEADAKDISKIILGEDSQLPLSNRILFDPKIKESIISKIDELKKHFKNSFSKTVFGKNVDQIQASLKSLKQEFSNGVTEETPKKKPAKTEQSDQETAELLRDIENAAEDISKTTQKSSNPKPNKSDAKFDADRQLDEFESAATKFINSIAKYNNEILPNRIKSTIADLNIYGSSKLGDLYRQIVLPSTGGERAENEDIYLTVCNILEDKRFTDFFSKYPSFKSLRKFFISTSEMQAKAQDKQNLPNLGVDLIESMFNADELSKAIFKQLADVPKSMGNFTGRVGNQQLTEGHDGEYIYNGKPIDIKDVDHQFSYFLNFLSKSGLNEDVVGYFKEIVNKTDLGNVLNKIICDEFVGGFLTNYESKKQSISKIHKAIDAQFGDAKFFTNLFKSMISNLNMFTPSVEGIHKERISVDNNVSIEIYESDNEYFVNLYYVNLPPRRFNLDNIGNRGYSNTILRNLSTNRSKTLQDIYKKIIEIVIREESLSGKIKNHQDSKYKDSTYFGEIVNKIDAEFKTITQSSVKYKNIIKRMAQFTGDEGHPAYGDDPLAKFTMSVNYQGKSSLFIDFVRISDDTFRINGIQLADGDRGLATKLINALNGKTGRFDGSLSKVHDISKMNELQKQELYKHITSFFVRFLSDSIAESGSVKTQPSVSIQESTPKSLPVVDKKRYSIQDLINLYNQYISLDKKEKKTASDEKKLSELADIVTDNLNDIQKALNIDIDLDDISSFQKDTDKFVKTLPKYEQDVLIKKLNDLNKQLESSKDPKVKKSLEQEIERLTGVLVSKGDFSKYNDSDLGLEAIESKLLDMSIEDVNPAEKTKMAAIALLKNSPKRKEYRSTAKRNLDKYPLLKEYIENHISKEFMELVYDNR